MSAEFIKWNDRKHENQRPVRYSQKVISIFVREWENHPLAIWNLQKKTAKRKKKKKLIPNNSVY